MEHPKHPQQHDADRQQRILRAASQATRCVRQRIRAVCNCYRMAPNCFQRDGQESEPEGLSDELAALQGKPKPIEQPKLNRAKGK